MPEHEDAKEAWRASAIEVQRAIVLALTTRPDDRRKDKAAGAMAPAAEMPMQTEAASAALLLVAGVQALALFLLQYM